MRFRKDLGNIEDLKKSIKELGLIHPIVIDSNGELIAGERRLKACQELGIEPEYRTVDFNNPEQAQIDENTIRKDFTPSEINAIYEYYHKKSRQGKRTDLNFIGNSYEVDRPIDIVAKVVNKDTKTLSKINQIFKSDNEEIKKKIDEGKISIDKGYNEIKKDERKKEKIEKLKEISIDFKDENIQIFYEDFQSYSKDLRDNSVNAIITDPPYPGEFLYLWQDLFNIAYRILKPSSFLICYSGQMYLDKIFRMNNELIYYWTANIIFSQKPLIPGRNIINEWKPILIFQKPPFKKISDTISDTISFNYSERDLHEKNWGQTIKPFEFLIEHFSNPGDLIFEPFAGTGTTLIASKRMKRKCIGCEIDKNKYQHIIEGRLVNEG